MPGVPPLLPPQFLAVSALPEAQRYQHFVSRVADSALIWSLRNARGWVSLTDPQGQAGLPVWPHPSYASACATGDWAGCEPSYIDLQEFVDQWLPDMAALGVQVDVFPTTGRFGVLVSALQLELHLREALASSGNTSINAPGFSTLGSASGS